MRRRSGGGEDQVHALEIATGDLSLLVPSACIAEVAPWPETGPVPCAPPWVLGVINWRQRPVAVISFGSLNGAPPPARSARAKLVVLYPPPGCRPWQFIALASAGEPQPRQIDAGTAPADPADLPAHPCIAGGVMLDGRAVAIPDFEALRRVLFP